MNIKINKNNETPYYRQIVNQIRMQIINGVLVDGLTLPSERKLAEKINVHRNTVTKAYQELKSEGYISSARGKGYKVTYSDTNIPRVNTNYERGTVPWEYLVNDEYLEYNSAFDDILSIAHTNKGISFAGGLVPPEVYNKEDIKLILEELVASGDDDIYEYSHYQGQLSLRKNLSSMLKSRSIIANPSEIQVVNETNQAIDYIYELFLRNDDVVITEEPVSPDIYRPLQLMGVKVVTAPVDEEGMIVDVVERLIKKDKPKFIIVNSSYQDPTGSIMSIERRKKLLELSSQNRIPIIEDDSASEINFDDKVIPSLKSLDKNGNVIYIYSFALTFAPGFRLACIVSNKQIIKKLSYIQSLHMVNLDSINQNIISKYIEKGFYDKNMRDICAIYKEKGELMSSLLKEKLSDYITFHQPQGGVYLWCKLKDNIKINKLMKESFKKGLYFIPGTFFYPNGDMGENYIRLNYSYASLDEIKEGIDILTGILKK